MAKFSLILAVVVVLLVVFYARDPFTMRSYQPAGVNISSLFENSVSNELKNRPVLVRGIIDERNGSYFIRNVGNTHELLLSHQDREGITECIAELQNLEVVLMGVFAGEGTLKRLFSIREVRSSQEERRHCKNQEDFALWFETDKI